MFYLELRLLNTKINRFVENTPMNAFNVLVQSAVNSRCQGDEDPNSGFVAETLKLLPNSSHGYQFMDRSRHSVTRYMNDEKTNAAINNRKFKRLGHISEQLYEVELAKLEIEQKKSIIVGSFFLHYAKLRLLELHCKFFTDVCNTDKCEEIEMDTDSLFLALAKKLWLYTKRKMQE